MMNREKFRVFQMRMTLLIQNTDDVNFTDFLEEAFRVMFPKDVFRPSSDVTVYLEKHTSFPHGIIFIVSVLLQRILPYIYLLN